MTQIVTAVYAKPEDEMEQLLQELTIIRSQIQSDQVDIERIKAESKAITARTDATLSQIKIQLRAIEQAA